MVINSEDLNCLAPAFVSCVTLGHLLNFKCINFHIYKMGVIIVLQRNCEEPLNYFIKS